MRTHLALLRGVNVGGRNRLAMSDLRDAVASLGHRDVATSIQSGNVVFTAGAEVTAAGTHPSAAELAAAIETAVAERSGLRPGVVVLGRDELAAVVAANPYPDEVDPTHLHVRFHRGPLGPAAADAVAAAVRQARDKGSTDDATVAGSVVYLRTPGGMGRSELAVLLGRRPSGAPQDVTTTRSWATVTRLLSLLDAD